MEIEITPGRLSGRGAAVPSKSMAHRLLICAALARSPLTIQGGSGDIQATIRCLGALDTGLPLDCGESGTTLRFLLPVAAALGARAEFRLGKRLSHRPLAPLTRALTGHGVTLSQAGPGLCISGRLRPGGYRLPGNVSSQFISGLLLALPLLDGPSTLQVDGPVESAPYVEMTLAVMGRFGVQVLRQGNGFWIPPGEYRSPGPVEPEGDWSAAAFWLAANALGSRVQVTGLTEDSCQGDRIAPLLLARLGDTIGLAQTPDLAPPLAAAAAAWPGQTTFTHAARLRLKESDRIAALGAMVEQLGGRARETADGLVIRGCRLTGGVVDSAGDHRIAMAAAIAATACTGPVRIRGAEAVEKSYPRFWQDYRALGGNWKEWKP